MFGNGENAPSGDPIYVKHSMEGVGGQAGAACFFCMAFSNQN